MKNSVLVMMAILPFTLLLTGLNGCAGGGYDGGIPSTEPMPAPTPMSPDVDKSWESDEGSSSGEDVTIPSERMIVRNGSISLVVADVTEARDEIEQLATALGGWVVDSNIYGEAENMRGWISIRVGSDKFDQALAELRALAVRVSSESTSTKDITEEYVDLQSRLKNAEATEAQYLALLERAEAVDDILSIYDALSGIRYEIEQIKGRIQYLQQTSAMSLISVDLTPAVSLGPLVSPGWSASESLNSAIRGLTTFGQGLGTAFIWIGILSPIWGTILGITYWRRRRKRNQQAS
ncbi:MAG: DUF4349 domain-containing protein [Dehalococcoidales bacterium]|nr:DUF4349 domain-containing protein [Dehalococcoidales bacterium]